VNPQLGLQRKRWQPGFAFWLIWRNEFDQIGQQNHLPHLMQEHLLARFFNAQIAFQAGLFLGLYFLRPGLLQAQTQRSYAEFP
jgi:hypothetical protein